MSLSSCWRCRCSLQSGHFRSTSPTPTSFGAGSSQTYKLLSDSNADWGQQLKATSRYLRERGVKDCWFSYFAEGVVPYQYYGIPCKALPTPDAQWIGEKFYDVPAEIDGPVLISGSNLSGYEYGPAELNPYAQFQQLKPTAVIQNGVYVFDGHFAIPMAAAIGHVQKANEFLEAKRLEDALAEAQDGGRPGSDFGEGECHARRCTAKAMGQNDEARQSYEKALNLAQTIAPEFQVGWVATIQRKLADEVTTFVTILVATGLTVRNGFCYCLPTLERRVIQNI